MNKQRMLTSILCVVLAGAFLAGCRKPAPQETSTETTYDPRTDPLVNPPSLFAEPKDISEVDTEGTLFLQLEGNPNTLNPFFVSSGYDFTVVDTLYASPFTFDKDMQWMLNDDMAESLEDSDDHTTFTLKIKPGLIWHDGQPLTAHDIVYSWQQILDPDVPCQTQKPSLEPIKECVAIDDLTVKYVQPEPQRRGERIVLHGEVPSPSNPPSGCPFHPRCPIAEERCSRDIQHLEQKGEGKEHLVAYWKATSGRDGHCADAHDMV